MKTTRSNNGEEASPSHLPSATDAGPAVRLDQALEADQQCRREREAVLRRCLGHVHDLCQTGYQMSMLWLPCLTLAILVVAVVLPWDAQAFLYWMLTSPPTSIPPLSLLASLLILPFLAMPFLAPLLILAATGITRLLLSRAGAQALEINREIPCATNTGSWGVTASEDEVQDELDGLFIREHFHGTICAAASAIFPASAALTAVLQWSSSYAPIPYDANLVGLMVSVAAGISGFVLIPESFGGLRSLCRRCALLEEARRKGLTVRDPASSPWN